MYQISNSLSDVMNLSTILFIMSPLDEFKLLEKKYFKEIIQCKLVMNPFKVIKSPDITNKEFFSVRVKAGV